MAKKESEAIKAVRGMDEFCQAKYREILLLMNQFTDIYQADVNLTKMGLTTPESKLEALDPLFKKDHVCNNFGSRIFLERGLR